MGVGLGPARAMVLPGQPGEILPLAKGLPESRWLAVGGEGLLLLARQAVSHQQGIIGLYRGEHLHTGGVDSLGRRGLGQSLADGRIAHDEVRGHGRPDFAFGAVTQGRQRVDAVVGLDGELAPGRLPGGQLVALHGGQ